MIYTYVYYVYTCIYVGICSTTSISVPERADAMPRLPRSPPPTPLYIHNSPTMPVVFHCFMLQLIYNIIFYM